MADASRTDGGNVAAVPEIDAVMTAGPRRAGSEAERRAARYLERSLRELGREAQVEPTRVRPSFGLTHLIHAVAGIVASVLSVYQPPAGLALAAVATASAFGDLTGAFYLVRMLTPVRASQNVRSADERAKPGLIVIVAHYDAPVTGMLLDRRLRRWPLALLGSLALIAVCALGRLAGLDATWFTLLQFIPTVVLIAMTPLFADAAISDTGAGLADNAAGVSAALRLAESQSGRLSHFDLMVLFSGASAHSGLGMRAWLKRHGNELDPAATAVIAIDNVGDGVPAYAVKEGPVFAARMHPTLVELAGGDAGEPFTSIEISDAYVARAAGLPALRISTAGGSAAADPDAITRVHDYVGDLLEQIDQEIGPLLT